VFYNKNHDKLFSTLVLIGIKYKPKKLNENKKIDEYVIDETLIKAGSEYIWLWVAIEPKDKEILSISISKEPNVFVAERFHSGIVDE